MDWLLDSDPAIRWQALRDLAGAPAEDVAAERAKVASEGWGASILARQQPDGAWPSDPRNESWTFSPEGTAYVSLLWLRDMGVDPGSAPVQEAIRRVRENVTWHWWDNHPFFVGEVEPCINGRVVAIGAYFGQDVTQLVDRLLGEQMADGGWNCERENGSTRGSFSTSINVLEGLLEFERAGSGSSEVTAARRRGEEYLLERRMLRRLSTGEVADASFTELWWPPGWHYDVLRGIEYLRAADLRDERAAEAIEIVAAKRGEDGRWLLDNIEWGQSVPEMDETIGAPSRWVTLRALRALRWWENSRP